ncbi:MAG: thioredoxin domain-containing protein, partial [Crocinitomicaceae bacterium]|nr:thioredoxin domain-containing protein [Crocinitomicaceae bacterium]
TDEELMQQMKWERISFETHLEKIKIALLYAREKRTRPRLDDKAITSWNAMIIRAYVEAYKAFGRKYFLETAISTAGSLLKHFCRTDDTLWHTFTKDRAAIDGFLDDYAFSIDAFISLHEVTGEEGWIAQALKWAELVHERFFDPDSGLYWYTSENAHELFVRQKETADNVMPSSNSSLCRSFFLLSRILENPYWEERSREMLSYMISSMSYGASCSNWLMALLAHTYPFREIVVTGPGAITEAELLQKHFLPNTMIMASTTERSLPLFRDRFSDTTAIYVCSGKSCSLPVTSAAEVLQEFEKQNDIRHT